MDGAADWIDAFHAFSASGAQASPAIWLGLALVAARVGAMLAIAPLFGRRGTPWRVRVALVLALVLLLAPSVAPKVAPAATSTSLDESQWMAWLCREAAIGLALGLAVMMLAAGLAMAGELVSDAVGLRRGEQADESEEGSAGGRLLELSAFAVLLAAGGHRLVIAALLDTFRAIPCGAADSIEWPTLLTLASHSFSFGLRAAAPVVAAALTAQLLLAMLARFQPMLRNAAIHSSSATLAGVGVWLLSLGTVGLLATDELQVILERVQELLGASL